MLRKKIEKLKTIKRSKGGPQMMPGQDIYGVCRGFLPSRPICSHRNTPGYTGFERKTQWGDPEPLKNQVCEGTFYLQRKMRNGFGETFVSAQLMLASTDLVCR